MIKFNVITTNPRNSTKSFFNRKFLHQKFLKSMENRQKNHIHNIFIYKILTNHKFKVKSRQLLNRK
jgi:hypothetical protein